MCQIPDGYGIYLMRLSGQGLHVVQAPAAVIDLGQHQNCQLVVDVIANFFRFNDLQLIIPAKRLQ
jgi:hypothetical protein